MTSGMPETDSLSSAGGRPNPSTWFMVDIDHVGFGDECRAFRWTADNGTEALGHPEKIEPDRSGPVCGNQGPASRDSVTGDVGG
jgi:hypothetical protein